MVNELSVYDPTGNPDDGSTPVFIAEAELAETALLGAVLQVPGYQDVQELTRLVSAGPDGGDFLQMRNAAIWSSILRVHGRGDRPTVMEVLDDMGALAHRLPGGATYLHTLMSRPDVLSFHAPRYARKVRSLSIRRQIGAVGAQMLQLKDNPDLTEEAFLGQITEWLDRFSLVTDGGTTDVRDALEAVIEVAQHGEPNALPTPWPDLTEFIGGWYPGQLIVIGARPGVGKSLFIENSVTDVTRNHDRDALYVSLEMTAKEITQRTLAHTAKVLLRRIRAGAGALDERDWTAINRASGIIAEHRVTFADRKGQTFAEIRSAAHAAAQKSRRAGRHLGLVGIDYAGLVEARDPKLLRHLHIGEVSRGSKKLAGDYDTTVLLAAQLNREGKDRMKEPPRLTDLKESGDLEQDADVVILLHEVFEDDGRQLIPTGELEFHIAKNRNGPTGVRSVSKVGQYAKLAPNDQRILRAV